METLRIKLCGLTETDKTAFQSVLSLSSALLTSDWQCVDSEKADLEIYCFETPAGIAAWQQRSLGCFSALLSTQNTVTETVDIVLKKPLRTSQLSAALNLIEEKISPPFSTHIPNQYAANAIVQTDAHAHFKTFWRRAVDKLAFSRPVKDLPTLNFRLPPISNTTLSASLLNEKNLQNWLKALPEHPFERIQLLHGRLTILAQHALPTQAVFTVLPHYQAALEVLLFARGGARLIAEQYEITAYQHSVTLLKSALESLAQCYLRIAEGFYLRGQRPSHHPLYLYTLNQGTQALIGTVLQGFQHYQQPAHGIVKLIHQLYLYHESAGALDLQPRNRKFEPLPSFRTRYLQFLMIGMTDPYSLPRFAVLRLFKAFATITDQAEIQLLSDRQKQISNEFLLTGHFCIDLVSDALPVAMAKASSRVRNAPTTRLVNTQPVLRTLTQQSLAVSSFKTIERQLIINVLPQLNASYERLFHRFPVTQPRLVSFIASLPDIHQALDQTPSAGLIWQVLNEAAQGMLLMQQRMTFDQLPIGQLLLMHDSDQPPRLAQLEWLCIDQRYQVQAGISFMPTLPEAVYLHSENHQETFRCLKVQHEKQPALIGPKGIYSESRRFHLQTADKILLIEAGALIFNHQDYEYFHYRHLPVL